MDNRQSIYSICHIAWQKGLMCGWSGNASIRIGADAFVITRAGSAKGFLQAQDCLLINSKGEIINGAGRASSETGLHLILYAKNADCKAILHTHPEKLQALDLALAGNYEQFLRVPLYEAQMWRPCLFFADRFAPGSGELARAAQAALPQAVSLPCALWLSGHGLCALAQDLQSALCLTEELEHIAAVQLQSGAV